MSALGEQVLLQRLSEDESMATLAREGLDPVCVPTEELREIYVWAMEVYHRGGRAMAPSVAVLRKEWGDVLDDNEIDLEAEPEGTIEWAIDDLKGTYINVQVSQLNKALAVDMSEATTQERVEIIHEYSALMVGLSVSMESQDSRVDMREGIDERLLEYERRKLDKGYVYGMRFGLPMIDEYTRGIHPGELAVLAAGPKVGKALATGTRVKTPTGWTNVENLKVGDEVVGSAGVPIRVKATARWANRPLMRVRLDDGGEVVVDEAHDWTVFPHVGNSPTKVVDTKFLRDKIQTHQRFAYLPLPQPTPGGGDLPVDPYLLGLLLGDGGLTTATPTFTTTDPELIDAVQLLVPEGVITRQRTSMNWSLVHPGQVKNELTRRLRGLGVMGHRCEAKAIPDLYMASSPESRLALLQGLLDTDGGVDGKGVTFCSTSKRLAYQVRELVLSLGGTVRIREKPIEKGLDAFVVRLRLEKPLFRLTRKLEAYQERGAVKARPPSRRIIEISPSGSGDTVCIEVDAPDSLFMVEDYILTHNSYLLARVALSEWRSGRASSLYTLENSVEMTEDRIISLATGVDPRSFQQAECTEEEMDRVSDFRKELRESDVPLRVIQPEPGRRTVESIIRDAQMTETESLLIDQLTFLEVENERQPRHLQIRELTHKIKTMISTGRDRMPCLLAHQINREGVRAADKLGYLDMTHLAEGSEVERTADWAFGIHRSQTEVMNLVAKLQTLAVRREDNRHFMLRWSIDTGHIWPMYEMDLETGLRKAGENNG